MNKYTIRTETETIYTDKVEVLEKTISTFLMYL